MIHYKWVKNSVCDDARKIRTVVFVEEQGVSPEEEYDGSDSFAECAVMYLDDTPVATGRIILGEKGECMIGRVACLKEYRGKHYGYMLMQEILNKCSEKGFDEVYVHAQIRAEGFYEALGFRQYGEVYMEANIPHINMKKDL